MDKQSKASEREAFRLIDKMLKLMESRGLVELEMEHEGMRIRLKRASAGQGVPVVEYAPGAPQAGGPVTAPAGPPPATPERDRIVIKSPMVGTFYQSPAPDAPPFVEIGQEIEVGQVICILEAMKLMNEIKSETTGRIMEILVESGAPVEFGQALFVVEPRT